MKFRCNSKELVSAISTAIRVMAVRSPMEILEGVLLKADETGLTVTASDGNMTSVTRIGAEIAQEGSAIIPGRLLGEVVRKLPDGEVDASLSDSCVLTIRCGYSRTNIAGRSADEYPLPEEGGFDDEIELPQPFIKEMIQQVAFAVPAEDQRVVLTGGFLNMADGKIDMVGLDGFRMAVRSARVSDVGKRAKAIIPSKALDEIAKLMSDDEEKKALIRLGKNRVLVENGQTKFYASLIEGEYIDYRRVIPSQFNVTVKVDRQSFCDSVDRAALIARMSRSNLIRFDISEGTLVISASSEAGDAREELECTTQGGGLTISFNVRYFTELIRVISGDSLTIRLGTPVSPCVISPDEGEEFIYLVLPVRTNAQ
ncbi:MAG: DNA polymerase III subunit beta [Clostridia bacterium]|nr:DNA polymerase III subunit beta [Clostridia bacterium]MBR5751142.1 DNA polymerase III subunit beta [Clostridia bacterium]